MRCAPCTVSGRSPDDALRPFPKEVDASIYLSLFEGEKNAIHDADDSGRV